MATLTPILGLSKPIVGADDDVWGGMWNANADIIDGLVKPVDLAPYLLKAGGVMTGFLTLSANATNALHAVPFQQLNAGLATKIGDAPNDGGYYARRNLGWEPSPGSAINQDAPSDGFAYGRRNASWDKTLRLAGGVVIGPTTIMGSIFTAKGNISVGIAEPPNMSTATALDGGSIRAWTVTANNLMFSSYYDGTAFRRLNTLAPAQIQASGGTLVYQVGVAGAADSIWTPTSVFTVDAGGTGWFAKNLGVVYGTLPGTHTGLVSAQNVIVNNAYGTNLYHDGVGWKYRNAGSGTLIHLDTAVAPALNFFTAPVGAQGAVATISNIFAISPGGIWTGGALTVAGASTLTGWTTTGGVTVGSSLFVTTGISVGTTNSWEWTFYRDANADEIQAHRAGYYQRWTSSGGNWIWVGNNVQAMFLGPSGYLSAAGSIASGGIVSSTGADGNGYGASFQGGVWTHGQIYSDSNITAAGSVTGGYVHSTGDFLVGGNSYMQYARFGNGIMNYNGTFWVADNTNYYLQRGGDGTWRFVENGVVMCEVRPSGDLYVRTSGLFYGTIYCRNASTGVRYESGSWSTGNGFLFGWSTYVGGLAHVSVDNGGAVYALAAGSDARLKGEIADSNHDCLATVQALAVRRFRWRTDMDGPWGLAKARISEKAPLKRVGLVAQEVHAVFPEGVWEGDDFEDHLGRVWTLDQNNMIALLVGATQQMAARLATLEGRHK